LSRHPCHRHLCCPCQWDECNGGVEWKDSPKIWSTIVDKRERTAVAIKQQPRGTNVLALPRPPVRGPAIPPLLGPTGVQRLSVDGHAYDGQWPATAVNVAFPPPRQCPAIPPLIGPTGVKDRRSTTRARQLAPKGINPRLVEITICSCHQTMILATGLQGSRGVVKGRGGGQIQRRRGGEWTNGRWGHRQAVAAGSGGGDVAAGSGGVWFYDKCISPIHPSAPEFASGNYSYLL
jgi:hypothetical protein